MDRRQAVLKKAAGAAVDAACEQLDEKGTGGREAFTAFLAGYLLGFARDAAANDGVVCDAADVGHLDEAIATACPEAWKTGLVARAPAVKGAASQAGALVGRLEARCGCRKLLRLARDRMGEKDAGGLFLTDCDVAADPMQTRLPTLSLRFDSAERDVILNAFKTIED